MTALLERLEGAREGSRELDYAIKAWLEPRDEYWSLRVAADWTSSIDAALALAERLVPGLDIDLEMRPDPDGLRTDAIIYGHGYGPEPMATWRGWASSPALAICAALIRATAKEEAGG